MTELVQYDPTRNAHGAPADLVAWADSARAAAGIAVSLVKTSFVPVAFKNKPEEATAAILSGVELGMSPMAALRSFDLIQGVAAPRAMTLRAVVQAAGHEIWTEDATPSKAIVCGRRRGSEHVERCVWTMDRAKGLGLVTKDNWRKQPQAMLLARATSECARLVAADAILGIPYSSEEMQDQEPEQTTPVTRLKAVSAKPTQRKTAAAEKPEAPEPDLDDPTPDPAPESITDAQMKKLHASLNECGLPDRESALEFISETLERLVETSKDLTKDEASRVIDRLEQILRPEMPGDDGPAEPAREDTSPS